MRKTCLLVLLATAACVGGYYAFLRTRIDRPVDLVVSSLAGVSLMVFFGALGLIYRLSKDRRLIRSAESAGPFRDGKMVAAMGRIEPLGTATLQAPFTGSTCAVYSYDVSHESISTDAQRQTQVSTAQDCSGYGMIPCSIRTSHGDVVLLGFPILEQWPATKIESLADRERAQDYLRKTAFDEIDRNPVRALKEFEDLYNDPDSYVRKDIGTNLEMDEKHRIEERCVPVGASVCAIGIYSASRNGLITKMDLGGGMIRLLPAERSDQAVERVGKGVKVQIVFGIVFFLMMHAFLAAILYFTSPRQMAESEQWSAMQRALQDNDFAGLERLLQRGAHPDVRDQSGETLLYGNTRVPEAVRLLLQYHADPNARSPNNDDTPLFRAARQADPETVQMLVRAGADVNAVSHDPWEHRPIDNAISGEREDIVKALVGAGAHDPRVTAANGTPVGPDDEPVKVCREYNQAIFGEDPQAIQNLSTPRVPGFFQKIDFEEWKSAYLETIEEATGFRNDSAATIRLTGITGEGERAHWIFQLIHDPEGWKIRDLYRVSH